MSGSITVSRFAGISTAVLVAALAGCADDPLSTGPAGTAAPDVALSRITMSADVAPAPTAAATFAGRSVEFWPYTGTSFRANADGTGQDPINLIFFGKSDPRRIRAALMSLGGDRTALGFPNAFPFNCTWSDAIGNVQTAYTAGSGWVGGAVQLECGPYGPIRFHLRLFRAGDVTLGNAHFELLIPNTTEHEVLSWTLAQQLVTADLARTGLLGAAPTPTAPTHAVAFHEIRAAVYNGLPVSLRAAIGGPLGNVSANVPIQSTGVAMMFHLARSVPVVAGVDAEEILVTWNQVIPKPFCFAGPVAGAQDYVLVQGPITLRQRAGIDASGSYFSNFSAEATLRLTPIDPRTGSVLGATYSAKVVEIHTGLLTNAVAKAYQLQKQVEVPREGPFRGSLNSRLQVGPTKEASSYTLDIDC